MDSYTKTIISNSLDSTKPSLASIALESLYSTYIVKPLQKAWNHKDKDALRKKYICYNCKKPIHHDMNKYICRYCTYIQTYIEEESKRLDSYP